MRELSTLIAVGASLAALVLFACGEGGETGLGTGAGDTTTTGMTSTMVTSSSTGVTTTTTMTSTFICEPPAAAGSIYELVDIPLVPPKDPTSMCQYRGEVLLIFNAAAI